MSHSGVGAAHTHTHTRGHYAQCEPACHTLTPTHTHTLSHCTFIDCLLVLCSRNNCVIVVRADQRKCTHTHTRTRTHTHTHAHKPTSFIAFTAYVPHVACCTLFTMVHGHISSLFCQREFFAFLLLSFKAFVFFPFLLDFLPYFAYGNCL